MAAKAKEIAAGTSSGSDSDDTSAETIKHIMLSYNWDHHQAIKRINTALKAREYNVWIDIEKMQGSTIEAMSAAVEDCAVMCLVSCKAHTEQ